MLTTLQLVTVLLAAISLVAIGYVMGSMHTPKETKEIRKEVKEVKTSWDSSPIDVCDYVSEEWSETQVGSMTVYSHSNEGRNG